MLIYAPDMLGSVLRCVSPQAAQYKHVFDCSTPLHQAVLHSHRSIHPRRRPQRSVRHITIHRSIHTQLNDSISQLFTPCRSATAILLAASLAFPSLAPILKAADAQASLSTQVALFIVELFAQLEFNCALTRPDHPQGRRPTDCAALVGNADIISILNYPEGCKEVRLAEFLFNRIR